MYDVNILASIVGHSQSEFTPVLIAGERENSRTPPPGTKNNSATEERKEVLQIFFRKML